jgi:hypothetical protein
MLGQLGVHRPLDQPLGQLRQHAARPDDLLLRPGAGEQLIDQPCSRFEPEGSRKGSNPEQGRAFAIQGRRKSPDLRGFLRAL